MPDLRSEAQREADESFDVAYWGCRDAQRRLRRAERWMLLSHLLSGAALALSIGAIVWVHFHP